MSDEQALITRTKQYLEALISLGEKMDQDMASITEERFRNYIKRLANKKV